MGGTRIGGHVIKMQHLKNQYGESCSTHCGEKIHERLFRTAGAHIGQEDPIADHGHKDEFDHAYETGDDDGGNPRRLVFILEIGERRSITEFGVCDLAAPQALDARAGGVRLGHWYSLTIAACCTPICTRRARR